MASSLQSGINAAKAGRMQEALGFLKDAIIDEPQNADVWVWIAAIIDDMDKQKIFLDKALEIDPHNIPAQRGLAYLQKRKRDQAAVEGDHLSDHTSPISPFPAANRPRPVQTDNGWSKIQLDDVENFAEGSAERRSPDSLDPIPAGGFFKNLPKLSGFEIALLGVVVVVFCFIGILAASALFDIELPLGFLSAKNTTLTNAPPYPGVFLYEGEIFYDIHRHEGLPSEEVGIPTSLLADPTILWWQPESNPETVNLIYETGEYIPITISIGRSKTGLIQAEQPLASGLYCLQQPSNQPATQAAIYWCFRIDLAVGE